MYSKLLIANRGEIACRILRTCRRMGISTVAIYSEFDKNARHVEEADEAHCVGPPPPSHSYLNSRKILEVALESGVEAVHPGYGFLSENASFARACEEKGIKFIGPHSEVLEQMGDKLTARRLAIKAGLPVAAGVPVTGNDLQKHAAAEKVGYPLIVKGVQAGGGIGMRIVHGAHELVGAVERAQALVEASFGSAEVYLERYLEGASHIEIQIVADNHGNIVHLGERDCSVQRRHQKVIEETPAVRLSDKLRGRISRAAVNFARAINYTNVGTVEFIVDYKGNFYFLEMNPRIQVEHPVTEMVTGVDVVEQQLQIAWGKKLDFQQKKVRPEGHAIEARILAENPVSLRPTPGEIWRLEQPVSDHVRMDSGLFVGAEVGSDYDPLLAKLIAWGATRQDAIDRLKEGLKSLVIDGLTTNVPLIHRILRHPEFLEGYYTTDFLGNLLEAMPEDYEEKSLAAAIAASVAMAQEQNKGRVPSRWRLDGRKRIVTSRIRSGVSS